VYIDMSTIDPETTRRVGARMKSKGADMIDSPVGKTADAAVGWRTERHDSWRKRVSSRIANAIRTRINACGTVDADGDELKLVY